MVAASLRGVTRAGWALMRRDARRSIALSREWQFRGHNRESVRPLACLHRAQSTLTPLLHATQPCTLLVSSKARRDHEMAAVPSVRRGNASRVRGLGSQGHRAASDEVVEKIINFLLTMPFPFLFSHLHSIFLFSCPHFICLSPTSESPHIDRHNGRLDPAHSTKRHNVDTADW